MAAAERLASSLRNMPAHPRPPPAHRPGVDDRDEPGHDAGERLCAFAAAVVFPAKARALLLPARGEKVAEGRMRGRA